MITLEHGPCAWHLCCSSSGTPKWECRMSGLPQQSKAWSFCGPLGHRPCPGTLFVLLCLGSGLCRMRDKSKVYFSTLLTSWGVDSPSVCGAVPFIAQELASRPGICKIYIMRRVDRLGTQQNIFLFFFPRLKTTSLQGLRFQCSLPLKAWLCP